MRGRSMPTGKKVKPTLFSLLTRLSPVERQKFGAKRRKLKNQSGVREELVQDAETGAWRLEYWKGRMKFGELNF